LANGECQAKVEPAAAESVTPVAPPTPHSILQPLGSFVFAVRGGFQMIGGGSTESSCSVDGGPCVFQDGETSFSERSYFMIGADALLHVAPGFRLGLGYELVPYSAIEAEDESEALHLGHEHALGAIVEGVVPVSTKLALALRAQGGLRMLAVGGDLAERNDEILGDCRDANLVRCEVDEGPLFGSTFGGLFGFVGAGKVRWRVDLSVQYVILNLAGSTVQTGTSTVSRSLSIHDTRSWVLGGVEL
jgi:hypothetical protein